MKLNLILLSILLALTPAAVFAKKEKKPKTEDRVEALEALTEYLLTRSSLVSSNGATDSADCGLTVDFDLSDFYGIPDFISSTNARDTSPPSVSETHSGNLVNLNNDGCDPGQFSPAASPTDIIAISRGTCLFTLKVQHAADAGYAAVLIYNAFVDPYDWEGQLLVPMGVPSDGSSTYVLPTVALSARDGIDLPALEGVPVTINGPAQFCTSAE